MRYLARAHFNAHAQWACVYTKTEKGFSSKRVRKILPGHGKDSAAQEKKVQNFTSCTCVSSCCACCGGQQRNLPGSPAVFVANQGHVAKMIFMSVLCLLFSTVYYFCTDWVSSTNKNTSEIALVTCLLRCATRSNQHPEAKPQVSYCICLVGLQDALSVCPAQMASR